MKPYHRILDRLTAAARQAPRAPSGEMPPGMATRVLAGLRERTADRLWWESLAARAAIAACAAAAVCALLPAPAPHAGDDPVGVASEILLTALNPE